jgi:hypothetical protein
MVAGGRIVLKGVASSQDGTPYKIESLSGTDAVVLETAPTVAPVATDLVYAGGPLTSTIRDAILAHINGDTLLADSNGPLPSAIAASTVNLRVLLDGIGTANPAGIYGSWRGALLKGALSTIAVHARRTQPRHRDACRRPGVDGLRVPERQPDRLPDPGYVLVRRG